MTIEEVEYTEARKRRRRGSMVLSLTVLSDFRVIST